MIYALEQVQYQNDDIILRINDISSDMIIIEYGLCEIFMEFEGNEFVLERLSQGHIINSRSFFF